MKKWFIAAFIALVMVGCADNTAGLRVDGASQRVLFGDNVLAGRLLVEDIYTTEEAAHARGIVRLESRYNGDQSILYRFYWYDENGLEVNTKLGPWRQAIVRGLETIIISEVSLNPEGRQFRVQIRENNN